MHVGVRTAYNRVLLIKRCKHSRIHGPHVPVDAAPRHRDEGEEQETGDTFHAMGLPFIGPVNVVAGVLISSPARRQLSFRRVQLLDLVPYVANGAPLHVHQRPSAEKYTKTFAHRLIVPTPSDGLPSNQRVVAGQESPCVIAEGVVAQRLKDCFLVPAPRGGARLIRAFRGNTRSAGALGRDVRPVRSPNRDGRGVVRLSRPHLRFREDEHQPGGGCRNEDERER